MGNFTKARASETRWRGCGTAEPMGSDEGDDDEQEGADRFESTIPFSGRPKKTTSGTWEALVGADGAFDGRYRLERCLGEGAMGVVYRATEIALERSVAVKTIAPDLAGEGVFAAQFIEEARALARIRHQNVVQVYTFGRTQGMFYLVMEFVEGSSLGSILEEHAERDELLSVHAALAIITEMLDGVAAVHEAGLLHLDLKPSNVVIESGTGRPVIIDFGVAIQARTDPDSPIAGSPAYMSPEQADPGLVKLTRQSDIYALGCTAFEMLTGTLPYEADTVRQLTEMHRSDPIPLLSQRRRGLGVFNEVIHRALAKEPERRFESATEMKSALQQAQLKWTQRMMSPSNGPISMASPEEIRVLVVDDDPDFSRSAARATRLAFEKNPFKVVRAESGEQALAQAARRMPDVILLDYMLPNIDGIATLTAIRSLPDGRDARVVVITGGSIDQIAHRFRSLGVTTFLSKPVALDDLVQTVRKLASE